MSSSWLTVYLKVVSYCSIPFSVFSPFAATFANGLISWQKTVINEIRCQKSTTEPAARLELQTLAVPVARRSLPEPAIICQAILSHGV